MVCVFGRRFSVQREEGGVRERVGAEDKEKKGLERSKSFNLKFFSVRYTYQDVYLDQEVSLSGSRNTPFTSLNPTPNSSIFTGRFRV